MILGELSQVSAIRGSQRGVCRQKLCVPLNLLRLNLPAVPLAGHFVHQAVRLLQGLLRALEVHAQHLGLASAALEVVLELENLLVDLDKLLLVLGQILDGLLQDLGGLSQLLLHGVNPHEHGAVADASCDPLRQGRGGHGDAVNRGVVKGVTLFLEQLLHVVSDLGGDLPRIKVHDALDGAAPREELLHRSPRVVVVPHEPEHTVQHIVDGLWRHLQRTDLVEVVRLDAADGFLCGIQDGLDLCQLFLDAVLLLGVFVLLDLRGNLHLLHLLPALGRALHGCGDALKGLLGQRLLLREYLLFHLGGRFQLLHRLADFMELLQALLQVRGLA
mmetsp:Transcript_110736/g.352736  ORF Transcript_110736/g.352736 Transcript_110736/m.352736 type:complete len:331 (-) Transcript_110736:3499-4491(-)